ncbi:hypothetical protein EYV94_23550 [Puteibacter caeruleilacunae]|nr:hypothetical protein EYV94_23550 [Puteibacter caeruleilacunae]
MQKLIDLFILNCKQATLFIEKKKEGKLSFIRNLQLKLHMKACVYCRLYKKQSHIIDKETIELAKYCSHSSELRMSENKKEETQRRIKDQLDS